MNNTRNNKLIGIYCGPLYFPQNLMHTWDETNIETRGIGGSEVWAIEISHEFAKMGYNVIVFADCEAYHVSIYNNHVAFAPYKFFHNMAKVTEFEYFISSRRLMPLLYGVKAKRKVLMLHDTFILDTPPEGLKDFIIPADYIGFLSRYQREEFEKKYGKIPNENVVFTELSVRPEMYNDADKVLKENKMLWSSHKTRGAKFLITEVLPLIRKEIPNFRIEVCSYTDDLDDDYFKTEGVELLGNLGAKEIAEHQLNSRIWIYPCLDTTNDGIPVGETFCITALENGMAKNALVVPKRTGLEHSLFWLDDDYFIKTDIFDSEESIADPVKRKEYAKLLADTAIRILKSPKESAAKGENARKAVELFKWPKIADNFIDHITPLDDKLNELRSEYNKARESNIIKEEDENPKWSEKTEITQEPTLVEKDQALTNELERTDPETLYPRVTVNFQPLNMVYYMWVPTEYTPYMKRIMDIHYECLKLAAKVMDNATFFLAMDNINDTKAIKPIEERLVSLGWKGSLSFKVIKNNPDLREGGVFYEEIMEKLRSYDGLTFFAHSKGLTNDKIVWDNKVNAESVESWITAMYYLNLSYIDEVKFHLLRNPQQMCYGAFLQKTGKIMDRTAWNYTGSFVWLNTGKVRNFLDVHSIELPVCVDRTYAESMLQMIIPFNFDYIASHLLYYVNFDTFIYRSMYTDAGRFIKAVMPKEDEYQDYLKYHEDIMKTIEKQ